MNNTYTPLGIRLTSEPSEDVIVTLYTPSILSTELVVKNHYEGIDSTYEDKNISLTFTKENWNKPQELRLVGKNDAGDNDGSITTDIAFNISSNDAKYNFDRHLAVTTIDDDAFFSPDLIASISHQLSLAKKQDESGSNSL